MLTLLRNGVNYKVYLSSVDSKMKDFIFVKIVELNEFSSDKLDLNNFCFEAINFYKVETYNYNDLPVV